MPRWVVYCHIHRESGRRYIGITKMTMMKRWNRHVYDATRKGIKVRFAAAIRRYGVSAFDHEILQMVESIEDANEAEKYWVWTYNTQNPVRGFNMTPGGECYLGRNPWDEPDYRIRSSKASKLRWQDPEIRSKNIAAIVTAANTPESKAKRTASSLAAHARPEVRAKVMASAAKLRGRAKAEWQKEAATRGRRIANAHLFEEVSCKNCSVTKLKLKKRRFKAYFCSVECSSSYRTQMTRSKIPDKERLQQMVGRFSISEVSRMLDVSRATVRSHCKRLGVSWTPHSI